MKIIENATFLNKDIYQLREVILTNFNQAEFDDYLGYKEIYRNTQTTCGYAFFFNLLKEKYSSLFSNFFITTRVDVHYNIFMNLNIDTAENYETIMLDPTCFSFENYTFLVGLTIEFEDIYIINEDGHWFAYFNRYEDFCILYQQDNG